MENSLLSDESAILIRCLNQSRQAAFASKGPAPVHIDLTAGLAIDTGKEFAFHIPGAGAVWAQNGRFVFGDAGLISFTGLNSLDTATLCAALAP